MKRVPSDTCCSKTRNGVLIHHCVALVVQRMQHLGQKVDTCTCYAIEVVMEHFEGCLRRESALADDIGQCGYESCRLLSNSRVLPVQASGVELNNELVVLR